MVDEQPFEIEIKNQAEMIVANIGLEPSKTIITLTGTDVMEISVNGFAQFQVEIDDEYVTIYSMIQEFYKDNLLTLKNHKMSREFPILRLGENILSLGQETLLKLKFIQWIDDFRLVFIV